MRGTSFVAFAALVLSGCAPAATQLIVSVDTDLPIPAQLDEITVSVRVGGTEVETERTTLTSRTGLPLTLSVIPDGESLGPIVVVATGLSDGDVVVERSAEVTLVRGETRVLPLFLLAGCVGVTCARAGETCGENGCAPRLVEDPPIFTGTLPTIDAGRMDTGTGEAGIPDGGVPRDVYIPPTCDDDMDCDDGAPCTTDRCNDVGACENVGDDTACDDGNPCTTDSCAVGGCDHPPAVGVSCDDGMYCNGLDRCGTDAACSTHDGNPCGAAACVETSDTCDIPCSTRAECPADTFGAWGACDYVDGCDEAATHTRTARTWSCNGSGDCVSADGTESDACSRDTDGATCGTGSCAGFGACGGFSDGCDESGVESRTCTDVLCTGGGCGAVNRTEDRGCVRDTDGASCGGTSCSSWGPCEGFTDGCDETGTQSRSCTDPVCADGSCAGPSRVETQACLRDTDGGWCGETTCDGWGACSYGDSCALSGTQSRNCTDYACSAGTCSPSGRVETGACGGRDTEGLDCSPGFNCEVHRCTGGACQYVTECRVGYYCCADRCLRTTIECFE